MLSQVEKAFASLAHFRKTRLRLKNFTFGRQWDDLMVTAEKQVMTEGEYAERRGRATMSNNMIHRLIKTLIGHFRDSQLDLSNSQTLEPSNTELDARMFEEFLISGCAVQRLSFERRPGFNDPLPWVDNVSPSEFFAYPLRDPRALDIELIGMFHTWSIDEIVGRFASGSRQRANELRQIVKARTNEPAGFEHCRIIEVWHRESSDSIRIHDPLGKFKTSLPAERQADISAENRRRRREGLPKLSSRFELSSQWVGRFFTADGLLLHSVTAPEHPFAVKFYPLIDGEIHSFVSSLVDQQKYINRLISLIDTMMACSAKGVLLFPKDDLAPEQADWSRVAELWADFNTIIPYDPKPGSPGPHQVVTNTAPVGAYDLLNLELRLFDRIGGVSDALKGQAAGNSAQLYDAQTRNSLAAISDLFASFNDFRLARDQKLSRLTR